MALVDIGKQFDSLPLESLIANPFLGVAKANAANVKSNIASFQAIAKEKVSWDVDDNISRGQDAFGNDIIDKRRSIYNVSALFVAEPSNFMIDEAEADFVMEVKSSETSQSSLDSNTEFGSEAKAGWGVFSLSVNVKGSVATHKENTRTSDNSAKYNLHVRGTQHPPTEGMSRVLDLMIRTLSPIDHYSDEKTQAAIDGTDEAEAKKQIEAAQLIVDKTEIKADIARGACEKAKRLAEGNPSLQPEVNRKQVALDAANEAFQDANDDLVLKQQALALLRKYKGKITYAEILQELSDEASAARSTSSQPAPSAPTGG